MFKETGWGWRDGGDGVVVGSSVAARAGGSCLLIPRQFRSREVDVNPHSLVSDPCPSAWPCLSKVP